MTSAQARQQGNRDGRGRYLGSAGEDQGDQGLEPPRRYATRDDAVQNEIIAALAPGCDRECEGHPGGPYDPMGETVYCDGTCLTDDQAVQAAYDIDEIADRVLGDHRQGYALQVDDGRFWRIVAECAR